jgi:hypothetical protein
LRSHIPPSPVENDGIQLQARARAGLRGRLTSSSYAPRPGDPYHEPIMRRLGEIFAVHAREGHVTFAYDAVAWYGRLA